MRLIAEASDTAKGFRPLILPHHAPETIFGSGARSARRSGTGEDFFSYRKYGFGDDARQIDWRHSARSDDIFIREHERLLPHHVYLDCDTSPAMQFNSRGNLPTKAYAAQRLLLAAAQLLMQGESKIAPLRTGGMRKNNFAELTQQLCAIHDDLPLLPPLSSRSFIFLAGDFHQGAEVWQDFIRRAHDMNVPGACIQMLDPVEYEFPFYGRIRLQSAEEDEAIMISSADIARPIYLERMAQEQNNMQKLCERYGWYWLSLATDMPPRAQLGKFLQLFSFRQTESHRQ